MIDTQPDFSASARLPGGPIAKAPTGIAGFDRIAGGGLPRGRPTLVCGGPGCGKSLFAMEFLVNGAREFGEPGVFISFEESAPELAQNFASLGFDVAGLVERDLLAIDHVILNPNEIEESGEWNLEGLFVRLGLAIDSVGARRVALDTIETLFAGLPNEKILRAELVRLFAWLKKRGVTAVVTGEKGTGSFTRHGLEEYVSDCVVFLDHRVNEQVSTRRLRIVKYRGTVHGTNEYPFAISTTGFRVLPITELGLSHQAPAERLSTGHAGIDRLLGGGPYRGSSILISGGAGSGKTTLSIQMVLAACRRGEKSLYFSFEESPAQIRRNLRSVGFDLDSDEARDRIQLIAIRPQLQGLESHLIDMQMKIEKSGASLVVFDPMNTLTGAGAGTVSHAETMMLRVIDSVKGHNITGVFVSLDSSRGDMHVSSLMDTWIHLHNTESNGERVRLLEVVKSRGTAHSNRITPFRFTGNGLELLDAAQPKEG
jgi:circadian clock protein KaiC